MNNSEQYRSNQAGGEPLSREQMEAILTDYAFERLPADQKQEFEAALHNYPDLQKDVNDIRVAFADFDKADYLEQRRRSARNVSVHVQEGLSASERSKARYRRYYMRLAPFALMCILIVFMYPPFEYPDAPTGSDPLAKPLSENPAVPSVNQEVGLPDLSDLEQFLLAEDDEILTALIDEYPEVSLAASESIEYAATFNVLDAEDAEILLQTSWHNNAGLSVLDLLPEDLLEAELQTLFEGVEHVASL